LRYTTSKQYRFRLTGYYSPPLSALIIVGALFVFIFGMYAAYFHSLWTATDFNEQL